MEPNNQIQYVKLNDAGTAQAGMTAFGNEQYQQYNPGLAYLFIGKNGEAKATGGVRVEDIRGLPAEVTGANLGLAARYGNMYGGVGLEGDARKNFENPDVRAHLGFNF